MKQALRRTYRDLERNRPAAEVEAASRAIAEHLVTLDIWRNARTVGAFLSLPAEIQTAALLDAAWADGKTVCVPFTLPEDNYYGLSRLAPAAPLAARRWNVREPVDPEPIDPATLDLILVPALAYDRQGNRLGHGGGHYDRLLAQVRGFRLGLAFHQQLAESLPVEPHDQPVHAILTDRHYLPLTQP
jgi:5-formyltetrahydrofolate cyclo-ligase